MNASLPANATYTYRQVMTDKGLRSFTDMVIQYGGEYYGSRHHGALAMHEIESETRAFQRRRMGN